MDAEAAPARIERQLKKLNELESDCIHSVEEVLSSVEEEKLTEEVLNEWDDFHSQILRISGRAEDFIAKNGVNTQCAASSEFTEHTLRESSYRYYSCQSLQEMCWNGLRFMMRSLLQLIRTRN